MTELLDKELTFKVIGAAMEAHRILGPGFLEAVYQGALERELHLQIIPFVRQVKLPVVYKDVIIGDYSRSRNNLEKPENRVRAPKGPHPIFGDLLGICSPFVKY